MSRKPTGTVRRSARGNDLVIERTFTGDLEDVWASVTRSESTARWIGPWEGEGGAGNTISLIMSFEEGAPACPAKIEVCEPPHRLHVATDSGDGSYWHLELSLRREGDRTVLTFVQRLSKPMLAGDTGPGWEYYLDRMVASRDGTPMPEFAEYHPSQCEHYLAAAREAEGTAT